MKKDQISENKNEKDIKKVTFSQNIELTDKKPKPQTNNPTKENDLNKNLVIEDEDVLKKFKEKRRRKHLNKNNFNREKAFSTVKHQIKEEFSLGKLGRIEWAKEHASANRPLNKIQEFTKSTNFCNCCNLPCETPGVIEKFSCMEKIENFGVCGKAVPLYFYFIKFCIISLIVSLFIMSIPITIINSIHLSDIKNYCNNITENNVYYDEDINITQICEKYSDTNISQITNFLDWFSKVSSDNLIDYKTLLKYNNNNPIYKKYSINEKIYVNYSIVGFICMISLFVINIFSIILFKATIKAEKIGNIQPSDYTVLITDLQKMVNEFKEKNKNEDKALNNNDNNDQDDLTGGVSDYEYINMSHLKTQIGQFTQFLIDNLFYSLKSKQNLNIFNLNLCYKLNDFMVLKEEQEDCKYKIFQIKNNPYQIEKNHQNNYTNDDRRYYKSPFTYVGLDWLYCSNKGKPLREYNKKKELYDKNLNSLVTKAKLDNFCGCIFATFNTVKDKEEFYNNFPHFFIESLYYKLKNIGYYLCCCFIDKKKRKRLARERIRVYLAPEPEDVIWENMEFSVFQRFYRIIIIYFLSFLLIGFAFVVVYLLNNYQDSIEEKNWSDTTKLIASFSITIVISLLNKFLEFIMEIFTKMEKQKSMTNFYLSYSIKLTIFTFMTSAFVPFLANYIRHEHNLNNHDNKILITNMLVLFLTNAFIHPVVWTINISLIIKKIRIYFIERRKVPNAMHFKTQKELNDIYELPSMEIASKYSYISMTILMTMFYLPIFPLGVPITMLGLVLAYFLEKYNFTHGYKRPEMLNEKLGEFYFDFFIIIMISYSIGDYVFTKGFFEKETWPIINIVFFSILSIIPYTKPIVYYFNSSKIFKVNSIPINEVYFSFYNDYQRQNPFTKKDGLYFYIKELKNRGYISKFMYDILIKNIEKINVMEIYYNTSKNPFLKEAQKTLTMINKKQFSMEDLKKSITRIFREKLKKSNSKNRTIEEEKYDISQSPDTEPKILEKINDDGKSESEKESNDGGSTNNIRNESSDSNDSINNNLNIRIASGDSNDSNDSNLNVRKYTETKNKKNKYTLYNDNNYCLTQAFTNKGSFLINQYQDPLLFSIGQSIKNIAFIDNYSDLKEFSKRTSLTKIPSLSEEENGSEENEMVHENDLEEEKYDDEGNDEVYEEKEDDKNIIE